MVMTPSGLRVTLVWYCSFRGFDTEVFERTTQADEEFAILTIDGGEGFLEVGFDNDTVIGSFKPPRLRVMT